SQYPADLRAQIEQHRKRWMAYKSPRPQPTERSERTMGIPVLVRYERRLVAVSSSPEAPALAFAYVNTVKLCYEWEGGSECPKREAQFAAEYQSAHPGGPFSAYLPLLEAHRWLCTAEGFERE